MISLSDLPQRIDEDNWYYEDNGGIDLVHIVRKENGTRYKTEHIKISWRKLRASLNRKDKGAKR